jgi:hypothetical protein
LAHHGIIYVPLGYGIAFPLLANLSEVHGGSPWGAGTFAVSSLLSLLQLVRFLHCFLMWSLLAKAKHSLIAFKGWRWFPSADSPRARNRRDSGQDLLRSRF